MARTKFYSKKKAKGFCKRVNGQFNDVRDIPECDANYTVTYKNDLVKSKLSKSYIKDRDLCLNDECDFDNAFWN